MSSQYPIDSPPLYLGPADDGPRAVAEREKSALREAIHEVCLARLGERGSKLTELLDRIEEKNGPKAAFDSLMKLMPYATPMLQRVTVEDPQGNALQMPAIHVTFAQPPPPGPVVHEAEVAILDGD